VPVDRVRDAAIDVLLRVFERGAYLNIALDKTLRRKSFNPRARRFLTLLVYGTVRHKTLCDFILTDRVRQPLDKLPPAILTILRMGVFQALFCRQVTFPAMVHTSVDLAKKRDHLGTARLVNAVLKRAPETLEDAGLPRATEDLAQYLRIRYSMPRWLVRRFTEQFGEEAEAACAALSEEAPTTLRANTLKTSVEELRQRLAKADVVAKKQTPVPEELTVIDGTPLRTKLFQNGFFFLQDPASMVSPHLMQPEPGERILDLCAAPGGKTTHLAQLAGGKAHVLAMDIHPGKLAQVQDNVERLGTPGVACLCGDGTRPPLAPGFHRVLVDAPCSGLGTLRRHPDLKWHAQSGDPARLGEIQRTLLRSAIELCENAGRIVYSVCTLTPEETDQVVQPFLDEGAVEPEDGPEWLEPWKEGKGRYRMLPHRSPMDGFFLTSLRKRS
jgi:16S rRNA (cytosine967-C5)-methyltransferase